MFTHLHVHTQYSLLDGAIKLDNLFQKTKELGMNAVAITDHGTMFGVTEFYQKALKEGIKPIIGCEVYLAKNKLTEKDRNNYHLVLLAKNNTGYKNLCKLVSIAQLKGFYYKPRIDREVLKEHSEGLIALSACLKGEIPSAFTNNEDADKIAHYYLNNFGEDFYLEVQENKLKIQTEINEKLFDMSKRLSIPLVATNDCHYLNKEDSFAHEVLLAVQSKKTLSDPKRFKFSTDDLYFKSENDMIKAFNDYTEALENTNKIADLCDVSFDFKTYHFPKFKSELTPEELFEQQARKGFAKRIPNASDVYKQRLEYELNTIKEMGFVDYFLIVADFISFAKENGIPVGPGRGSVAGSIIAYAMGITDIEPIEYGLIFERFLNPSRISMPDIDVDFCIHGREKVYKYIAEKYGHVAHIITFGTLKTKSVIRDVGRVLEIPLKEVDKIAKMVPDSANSIDDIPEILKLGNNNLKIKELIDVARTLEGLTRHASTHAAGIVVSDNPLTDHLPLFKGKNNETVTQFDMNYVEKIGLVKFDLLGLKNLTIIDSALNFIKTDKPDLLNLDFNDAKTYELLSKGNTTGVFQLESTGIKNLVMRVKPTCFNDIIALIALYRPGPLESGMVDDFVERIRGREPIEYLLPQLESVLKETYGVIIYQEQIMKIAGVLADYTMAEADSLRKGIGKKIPEMLAEHRTRFVEGCIKNGVSKNQAVKIFDLIEKFGGYGFNKSHSTAYALISYQTAYLKAHYPVEFMAALLTNELNSTDNIVKFISECKANNVEVLPPDVNESNIGFTVINSKIRFGLIAIKNVGEVAVNQILEARKSGLFTSLSNFRDRVNKSKVNKKIVERLIQCGAFDSIENDRGALLGQKLTHEDILKYEKESLGFYITEHPIDRYKDIFTYFANADSTSINDIEYKKEVKMGGMINSIKEIRTKHGDKMAFVNIEDLHGNFDCIFFPEIYEKYKDSIQEDAILFIKGEKQKGIISKKLFIPKELEIVNKIRLG